VTALQRSHHALVSSLAAMLILSLLSSSYLLLVSEPRVELYTQLSRQSRLSYEAMLDQETGLRGWVATDDESFLQPYHAGRRVVSSTSGRMVQQAAGDPEVLDRLVDMMLARQAWQGWAEDAVGGAAPQMERSNGELSRFLLQGKDLFDSYRKADAAATGLVVAHRDRALDQQRVSLVLVLVAYVTATLMAAALAVRRRRRLEDTLVRPIGTVLMTIDALRSGDLGARSPATGVAELDTMGEALGALAGDLRAAGERAAAREDRLALLAARLGTVVRITREVSGSLSVRYVSEAVVSGAAELLCATATLWVRTEDGQFHAARRSDEPHGRVPPSDLPAPSLVATSAADARPSFDDTSRAYPLVLAGMVVGVLHVQTPRADQDTEEVLEALLSTAASALESARLHSAVRDLADHDALTQLPNRRRMQSDLVTECERSHRYGRPLTFVMIDLDHFKRLNDRYGHVVGDAVLHAVATALDQCLRTTDTAYRYGGEELAVLLRETGVEAAAALAERLRAAVAGLRMPESGVRVTASLGLAEWTGQMREPSDLIAAADTALYAAKRAGRDRVVVHSGSLNSGSLHTS